MFPSFNAIEEIKISETLNPAEFGGVADITTISKSGTNELHGGVFENVQNTDFNAADTFSHIVTEDKLNNFGVYMGGPVIFPKLYNGRNKTFFFGSYESARLPKSETYVMSVPTQAMRNGDLSAYLDPEPGRRGESVDRLSRQYHSREPVESLLAETDGFDLPVAQLRPARGHCRTTIVGDYAIPINSAQGDIRLDQSLGPKHLIFVRYTYKNRRITTPQEMASIPATQAVRCWEASRGRRSIILSPPLTTG